MAKLSAKALQTLFKDKYLLGASYKIVNKDNDSFFSYPIKPLLKGVNFGKVDGKEDFFETTITVNPRTQAQDDRVTSLIPVLEEMNYVRLEGAEQTNPLSTLRKVLDGGDIAYEELVACKELSISLGFSNASVVNKTITKEVVHLVTLTEYDEELEEGQELQLLFGSQDNLHGLSTYINREFTRADLRKFTELLLSKVLSVELMFLRLTLEDVNAMIIDTPDVIGSPPTIDVEEDGTFIISVLHADGVMNVKDKNSSVMLVESNGSYILKFYSKTTGHSKLELYLK